MSYLGLNVNSQTINVESYSKQIRQHQKMQYCSNIALKTNTKLATFGDHGCAWSWEKQHADGNPDKARLLLEEAHALVIGLAKSSGALVWNLNLLVCMSGRLTKILYASGQGQANTVKMIVVGSGYFAHDGGQSLCF
ncbi:hypothetical protein ACA910_004485 [Epithemia clementina (nom. ined.)]